MKQNNDYYKIACNDQYYLQATLHLPYYNQIAVGAQQVAEKMIKSVAERTCVGIEKLMASHNLRALYTEIRKNEESFELDRDKLSTLKDFYFDARYPGDNYVDVDEEDCGFCISVMYDVVEAVNAFRQKYELPFQEFERKMLGNQQRK